MADETAHSTDLYALVQLALGQDPCEWLKIQRATNATWEEISFRLRSKMPEGRRVSRETLRTWWEARRLEEEA